jgi:hypothetical protein
MSTQPFNQSKPQIPAGSRQISDTTTTGVRPQGAPPTKVAPTNEPKPMPNPI